LGPPGAGFYAPGGRTLQDTTMPLVSRTQIATTAAPLRGAGAVSAAYENETFMNQWETTQPVVAAGQLVNTYTGEVADVYEDAMPPPNRSGGDPEAERKQQQRRLMAAEGNVNASHRKREQFLPMQAGDAGRALPLATSRLQTDVALERNERQGRDGYFNRKDLAPCEPEMTRNPLGFDGYNNRIRILPWQPVTQELETKDWVPNATLLPGDEKRPAQTVRLRRDAEPSDRMGLAASPAVLGEDGRAQVRASLAARDVEGRVDAGRGAGVYGAAAAPVVAEVRLAPDADAAARGGGGGVAGAAGARAVTQESVLRSLSSLANLPLPSPSKPAVEVPACIAQGAAAHRPSARREAEAGPSASSLAPGAAGAGLAAAQGQARSSRSELVTRRSDKATRTDEGQAALAAAAAAVPRRHCDQLVGRAGDRGGEGPRGAAAAAASQQAPARRADGRDAGQRGSAGAREATTAHAPSSGSVARKEERFVDAGRARATQPALEAAGGAALGTFVSAAPEREARVRDGVGEYAAVVAAVARTGAVTSHQTRQAEQPVYRQGYERHGGAQGTDFQRQAPRGWREPTEEAVLPPQLRSSARDDGDRSALPTGREARPPRVAKSPMKAQRSFLQDRARLFAEPSTRCEEVAAAVR
jgi:hypothetical protein